MDSAKQKEYLSIAYLRAVAAKAAVFFSCEIEDSDSVDVRLKKKINLDGVHFWSDIGFQLKATSSPSQYTESETTIEYTLKVKNYNDLRDNASTRKYLALLVLPQESKDWVELSVDELIIRKTLYWISLKGYPETTNTETIRISIPKNQILDEKAVENLIEENARRFI